MKLYKVLVGGRSCHGGEMSWSLPTESGPGEWHEVQGEPELCSRGLHLTDAPAWWWVPDAEAYEVEAEGVVGECADANDHKVVARRVRLLRRLDEAELATHAVFLSGEHSSNASRIVALGSSKVEAWGSSRVEASMECTVVSWRDTATVVVREHAVHIDRSGDGPPTAHVAKAPRKRTRKKAKP